MLSLSLRLKGVDARSVYCTDAGTRSHMPRDLKVPLSTACGLKVLPVCGLKGADVSCSECGAAGTCFHMTHFLTGFIGEPRGHEKVLAKSAFYETAHKSVAADA